MEVSTTAVESPTRLVDVLAHLPLASTTEYKETQVIYSPETPSRNIYLVVSGKVLIAQIAERGCEIPLDIVRPDELFGESAFLGGPHRCEQATAIEKAIVMTWPVSEMEEMISKRPKLAVALLQFVAQRNADFIRRIESLSLDTIDRRLARELLRFSERLGQPEEDGSVKLMPLTHELLSRYVGTSREIVTQYMNRFRRQGYVSYSRHGIVLDRNHLISFLRNDSAPAPTAAN